MTASPHHKAFRAERYDIGESRTKGSSGAAVTLTPLQEGEADYLGRVFAAIDPWKSYPFTAAALATYFAQLEPDAPRFALRAGDKLAGLVGLRLNWLRGPYLQFLGVVPDFQMAGLGTLALTWIDHEARIASAHNVFVCATDSNAKAIKFYKRHGFHHVGDLADLVQPGKTEVLMRRVL
jgi:diamine N-acetyltransferase